MQLLSRVKICGLCRPEDTRLAAESGADYLGVILAPGGPRTRSASEAAAIWAAAPGAKRAGVFVDPEADQAIEMAARLGLAVVQLHGSEDPGLAARIREAGEWRVWKAIRPRTGDEFAAAALAWAGRVDGILVDGFSERAHGGTGTQFPWEAVSRHRARVGPETEFIIAGGLSPDNVAGAIERLAPDTVDVSSGVESERCIKSAERVSAFIAAVGRARRNGEDTASHG